MTPSSRSLLLSAALVLTCSASFANIRLTPEQPIADPVVAAAEGTPRTSALVSDGNGFMAFWVASGGVHASAIDANGAVVGAPRVTIPAASTIFSLSACWTGSSYVVAWQQEVGDALYVATVSRDGNLQSEPHLVAQHARGNSRNLATNGRRVLLAYGVIVDSMLVDRFALLDRDANVIAKDLAPLGDTPSSVDTIPAVASDGNGFAIAWPRFSAPGAGIVSPPPVPVVSYDYFRFLRVDENGVALGSDFDLIMTSPVNSYGLAYGNGRYAFVTIQGSINGLTYLSRVVVDASNAATRLPDLRARGYAPDVFWNGNNFVAYWMDYDYNYYKLMTVTFSGDAETAMPQPVVALNAPYLGYEPRIGFNGRNTFVAWTEDPNNQVHGVNAAIAGQRFDPNVTTADTARVLVSTAWSRQFAPSIATSGADSLIVWNDEHGGGSPGDVLATRVAANGTILDRTPIKIASDSASAPDVVFDGRSYTVIWMEAGANGNSLVMRTVGRDGSLGPRTVLGGGWWSSVASNGSVTLVVTIGNDGVVGYRVDAGQVQRIAINGGYGFNPVVATDGTDFFVAWGIGSDFWQFPTPDLVDVVGARITAAGVVLDPTPIPIATGPADQIPGSVASNGRDYLVVYEYRRYPDTKHAAKRVFRDGTVEGKPDDVGTVITTDVAAVTVIANGTGGYIAAWTVENAIKVANLDERGTPRDVSTTSLITPIGSVLQIAQTAGHMLEMVYARRVSDAPYAGTSRVFFRLASDVGARSRAVRR